MIREGCCFEVAMEFADDYVEPPPLAPTEAEVANDL